MLLRATDISKSYSGHTALNSVSIEVKKGHVFGLLGPNGAGKTTLIRIINQILTADKGEVVIDGEKLNPSHIQEIGYLPEERGLYRKMKVEEQALYLTQLKGVDRKTAKIRLEKWLEKFDLEKWKNNKVETLSKGMQQKIQFIVTLLHKPKLLILDEPFSGFDPINTRIVKNEILELQKQGTTIIFSTHNMESVEEICNDIVLINKAKAILSGNVQEIKKSYSANIYEIGFEGNTIGFTNALWTDFELVEKKESGGLHKVKVKILKGRSLNDLLKAVLPHVKLHYVHELLPTMNDIFIEQVSELQETTADE